MVKYKKRTSFETYINPILKDIIKFRINCCLLKKGPRKNWVSENHVALARILPHVYGQYFLNVHADADQNEVFAMERVANALYVMIALTMSNDHIPEKS